MSSSRQHQRVSVNATAAVAAGVATDRQFNANNNNSSNNGKDNKDSALEQSVGSILEENGTLELAEFAIRKMQALHALDLDAELEDLQVLDEYDELMAVSLHLELEAAEERGDRGQVREKKHALRGLSREYKDRDDFRKQLHIEKKRNSRSANSLISRAIQRKRNESNATSTTAATASTNDAADAADLCLDAYAEVALIRQEARRRMSSSADPNLIKTRRFAKTILYKYLHF